MRLDINFPKHGRDGGSNSKWVRESNSFYIYPICWNMTCRWRWMGPWYVLNIEEQPVSEMHHLFIVNLKIYRSLECLICICICTYTVWAVNCLFLDIASVSINLMASFAPLYCIHIFDCLSIVFIFWCSHSSMMGARNGSAASRRAMTSLYFLKFLGRLQLLYVSQLDLDNLVWHQNSSMW